MRKMPQEDTQPAFIRAIESLKVQFLHKDVTSASVRLVFLIILNIFWRKEGPLAVTTVFAFHGLRSLSHTDAPSSWP